MNPTLSVLSLAAVGAALYAIVPPAKNASGSPAVAAVDAATTKAKGSPAKADAPTKTAAPAKAAAKAAKPQVRTASVYFRNCTAARRAGYWNIRAGDPGYARHLDRDGDGVACETRW
ncbi:excalibur calcium-binding domain-containing protein [Bosea sp. 2YAB26]|uniref:excalibur calcium-binding domain-containing protein n=1 Tax=Bosea sp. 2YAB26 TaxID=3237478 RepID=UPI003F8DD0D5